MEPIPETDEALGELERYGDEGLREDLRRLTTLAAEERLTSAAAQAGVPVPVLAHALVETFDPEP